METINTRILFIMNHFKMNKNSFSKYIGLNNNVTIGNIVSGRQNNPSYDIIIKILQSFDSIRTDWLLLGVGEMLKSQGKQDVQQNFMAGTVNNAVVHNGAVHHYASIKDAENKIEMLEKDNADQKNNIRILENALKDKEMVIEMLKEKLNREG